MYINLHCHTKSIKTGDGEERNCPSKEIFLERVYKNEIGIIAITNHNTFDKEQYNEYKQECLKRNILVLPGIELSIYLKNKEDFFHLIIVSDPEKIEDFDFFVSEIKTLKDKEKSTEDNFKLNLNQIITFLKDLNPIITVHYADKTPSIKDDDFVSLKNELKKIDLDNMICCEVSNIKNGSYQNLKEKIILSSDNKNWDEKCFVGDGNSNIKALFIDFNIDSYSGLRLFIENARSGIISSIEDKKISITYKNNNKDSNFNIYKNNLNLIFGKRGSGKSYLLDAINESLTKIYKNKIIYYSDKDKDKLETKYNFQKKEEELISEEKNNFSSDIKNITDIEKQKNQSKITNIIENIIDETSNKKVKDLKYFLEKFLKSDDFVKNSILSDFNKLKLDDFLKFLKVVFTSDNYSLFIINLKNDLENKLISAFIKELTSSFLERKNKLISGIFSNTNINNQSISNLVQDYKCYFFDKTEKIIEKIEFLKKVLVWKAKKECYFPFIHSGSWKFHGEIDSNFNLYYATYTRTKKTNTSLNRLMKNLLNDNIDWSELINLDLKIESFSSEIIYAIDEPKKEEKKFIVPSSGQKSYWELNSIFQENNIDFYIMDEPEKSLDALSVDEFVQKNIQKLINNEKTIIIASHNSNLNTVTIPKTIIYTEWENQKYNQFQGNLFSNSLINLCDKNYKKIWSDTAIEILEGGKKAFKMRGKLLNYGRK